MINFFNLLMKSINRIFPALLVAGPDFSALGVELPLGDAVLLRHVPAPRLKLDVDLGPGKIDLTVVQHHRTVQGCTTRALPGCVTVSKNLRFCNLLQAGEHNCITPYSHNLGRFFQCIPVCMM